MNIMILYMYMYMYVVLLSWHAPVLAPPTTSPLRYVRTNLTTIKGTLSLLLSLSLSLSHTQFMMNVYLQ